MLGIDGAGKTSILSYLKLGKVVPTLHTIGFNIETGEYRNFRIEAWDLSGAYRIRDLWKDYYRGSHGLVFVVDASARERMEEAKEELHKLLQREELKDVPVLVLANKQDLDGASIPEVTDRLALHSVKGHVWFIQGTCGLSGEGLTAGFDWLEGMT
jgi:ADP-ribosylation factor protein 1